MSAFEVSYAQRRLWLLDLLLPLGSIYNLARVARLDGVLDIDALRQALNEVVRRHQALRSRFAVENGEPTQAIVPELKLALEVEDLGALPEERRTHEAQRRVQDEARVPFDLAQGPLIRARLLRMEEHEHWLLLTFHHIVSDDWSMTVLWRELSALYDSHRLRSPSPLTALPMQYADHAQWQREWLQGDVLERQLAYWKQALADLPVLELPTDRVRPAQPGYHGRQVTFTLGDELTRSLRSLGHRERTTLFTTLLAALQVLLYRYTGQEDVAVGVPVAGRHRPDVEGLIGLFVNTLVLRGDLSGEPSFRDYLGRVRLRTQQAYAHQHIPFEMLVEELQPKRDSTRNPLFQVLMNKWSPEGQILRLTGLEPADVVSTDTGTAKFDLGFTVVERRGQCKITIEYATELFDATTIERMAGHFTTLIEAIVAAPDQHIGELHLLTEAERHQLLVEWNDTAVDYPGDRCAHQLFEAQAAGMPEAVAVVFEARQLTYGELNARANQLAHRLIALGVGPEVLVGICLDRSPELIIGLLGILKAGGAYVPLDPAWPSERARLVVEDARLAAVVTQRDHVDRLPPVVPMVFVDPRSESGEARAENNPDLPVSPADPVYVLYTSGTTGPPKGVLIEHRQLVQYVRAVADRLDLDARGNYAMLQPLTVDSCQTMIFPSLGRGGTLHLIREERALDAAQLTEYFGRHHIDYLKIAPSHLAALLDQLPSLALLPSRALIIGGEASHWDLIDRLWSLAPRCAIWNHYGPTETTVGVSACRLDPTDSRVAMTVPIGRPLANVRYYVLDQNLRPVPPGLPGELWIGGEQVARGYLNRPEPTAEKFLPDPFSEKPNARLYRSGDQVRYLVDGNVEFLGRRDQQVKIRGFRIEMGEIEAVLRDTRGVREAAVSPRDAAAGGRRLVAFVVPDGSEGLDDRGLKVSLATRLPDYMVPSRFILLPNLPRTPHGKVDRRALLEMDAAELAVETAYVAPAHALEELIAEVWREVLKLDRVGVHDNFFELGGHSLLAAQVLARLARRLKVELPLRGFFESPTVSALAAEARKRLGASDAREASPIVAQPRTGDLPLSFAQQRLWLLDRLLPGSTDYSIPTAWRLLGPLNALALQRSLDELVARHETLRTRFTVSDGEPVQVIDAPRPMALALTDLRAMAQTEREARARQMADTEARQPFDLERGPLLRAQLLRLATEEHLLLLNVHHIVSDGWSVGVFNRELAALYEAFCKGRSSPLGPLQIQYPDYAVWQRQRLKGETLDRLLAYWTRKLQGAPALLALPIDRPRTAHLDHHGQSRTLDLSPGLTASLSAMCQREGVTLFMALLSAFKVLLARHSGQEDIVVGTPIAGRDHVELEGLIGFFINTVVLRTDLSGNPAFEELLERVRTTVLEAIEHQDLPFEKLIEELDLEPDVSHTPVFQVFFNMLNMESMSASLSELEVERVALPETGAKFDLTLYAIEEGRKIRLTAVYRTELFHSETVERMLDQLHLLLAQIVLNPAARIYSYTLVGSRDCAVLPDPMAPLSCREETAIHDGFAAQAKRGPQRTAVVDSEGEWTYAELAAVSSRLANCLSGKGVRGGDVVAVYASPSAALVCCLLAILKAGGVFLILDSAQPAHRLRRCLEKAKPIALLSLGSAGALPGVIEECATGSELRCRLDIPASKSRVLDEFLLDCDAADPGVSVAGGDPAYVVFTSGSTGDPLGVLGIHLPVSHFLRWHIDNFGLREDDRFSLLSGLAHDPLLRDVFAPLWLGASLHIPPAGVREAPGSMARWLSTEGITVCHSAPALAELLGEPAPGNPDTLASLRWMFLGGETLTHGLVQQVRRWAPSCGLVNFYGTTETPQAMSFQVIDLDASAGRPPGEGVPIGKGIDGAQLLLLNPAGQRAGIRELAEIYVRTSYLGKGYLDEQTLTRERFLANPFTSAAEDRVYRTGDMGRYLPDGSVAFAGRKDQQLKLRGIRIEPAEVEAALRDCPAVRQAKVIAREDTPGDKRLVAYVVPRQAAISTAELKEHLLRMLPQYMVPSAFVFLEALPLTPSGKVDRKALPPPDAAAEAGRAYEAPAGEIETALAQIWVEVLKLERVSRHDNFFDLGGHSLLTIKVISLLHERTGVELPVRMLFESPTPATLAQRLANELQTTATGEAAAIGGGRFVIQRANPVAARRRLAPIDEILGNQLDYVRTWKGKRFTPDSFIVTLNESGKRQGLFWCLQGYRELTQLAGHLGSDQPVHGMRSGHLVMEYTDENVDAVATSYTAEMIALQPDGPFLLGGNCQGGRIARAIAKRLRELGRTVSLLILMEQRSFPTHDDPVALIFGRDSHFNPYAPGADPDAVFRSSYPAGFTVDIIAGAHGEFFESPNIESLASAVNRRLRDPSPGWRLRACLEAAQES